MRIRFFALIIIAIISLAAEAASYQPKLAHYTDAMNQCLPCTKNSYPPLNYSVYGDFVTLEGKKFWVEQYGKGSPTVIFFNGGGDTSRQWNKNIPIIAKHTTVIAYDRQGLGRSELIDKNPRTAEQMVTRLQEILKKIDAKPPYVLVGHSISGFYVSYFARRYPQQTAGIVTLDGNNRYQVFWNQLDTKQLSDAEKVLLKKLMRDPTHRIKIKKQAEQLLKKKNLTAKENAKLVEYLEIMGKLVSAREIENLGKLPKVPLIALTENTNSQDLEDNIWRASIKQFSKEVPCSIYKAMSDAGHYSMIDQPKLVNQAILTVVKAARERRTLCDSQTSL